MLFGRAVGRRLGRLEVVCGALWCVRMGGGAGVRQAEVTSKVRGNAKKSGVQRRCDMS